MTLIEAAALLGVTPDNLRGAIHRGSLKARKVGRDWSVEPREVERYRKEHLRVSGKATGVITDEGRRLAVDKELAKIEDALAALRRLAPLNEIERGHAGELAGFLGDLAGNLARR